LFVDAIASVLPLTPELDSADVVRGEEFEDCVESKLNSARVVLDAKSKAGSMWST
jgi:hypothetical protein